MKLRDLETFALVANLGSISRAAADLNVAQPSVSRLVAATEEYFGAQLLHRTGRGVVTTQAGTTVLAAIEDVIKTLAETRQDVREAQGIVSGRITVGITPMVGQTIVAKAVELMRSEYPDVELRVLEGNGTAIIKWLSDGAVDLALTYIPPAQIGDHELAEVLLEEKLCLVTTRSITASKVTLTEACSGALVLPGLDSGMRRHIDKLAHARNIEITPAHQIDSFPACMGLVLEGVADTIAPQMAVQSLVATGAVRSAQIVDPQIFARLSVHRSPKGPMTRAAKSFLAALKASRAAAHGKAG